MPGVKNPMCHVFPRIGKHHWHKDVEDDDNYNDDNSIYHVPMYRVHDDSDNDDNIIYHVR